MSVTLHLGNAVQWAREYSGEPFHALLCDPPYHLTSITKRFGSEGAAPAQFGKDGVFSRSSAGFMGKQWDGGDVAFDPATWEAFARIMYPGAFGMAFASSRGWHRMAVAIEDAGFVIHPSLFGWSYGSGFPKATRVDTQIDKEAGAEREVMGVYRRPDGSAPRENVKATKFSGRAYNNGQAGGNGNDPIVTAPATPLAAAFAGHRYGLQALKPALEPIIVFQKPYQGRPVDNITATGAGVLAIDAARIGTGGDKMDGGHAGTTALHGGGITSRVGTDNTTGRWPANFLLLNEEAAAALDRQSGTLKAGVAVRRNGNNGKGMFPVQIAEGSADSGFGDSGGASRFFFRVADQLDDADPVRYVAKASRRERDAGLEGFGLSIKRSLGSDADIIKFAYEVPDGIGEWLKAQREKAGLTQKDVARNFPSETGGLTGCVWNWENETSRPTPEQWIKLKQVIGFDERYDRVMTELVKTKAKIGTDDVSQRFVSDASRNPHPTVKPLALARYLATLLLPPAEFAPRRIFVPFAGVASECIGAMQAGWEDVQGVELTEEYLPIARARVEHWKAKGVQKELL